MLDTEVMAENLDITPIIDAFHARAEYLDSVEDPFDLDPAIVKLAQWITKEKRWLTKDDLEALCDVGGMLFRKQLLRHAQASATTNERVDRVAIDP
ncbi:hypothetical protein [Diaphorobacter caeni]|uniref:hypothetical protein n=1 Tax=Diaphorobacter caeni TaxID=2784387 RepID=UPI00188DFB2E|nr:hypothetical protein [Diaphorobacter caeni]MBF5005724.1 hypothetical protein [Diaphorobacter caeni]